jgi:peptidoglycan/xylan/chitin deacetylase (PgdA/CDA1 family)
MITLTYHEIAQSSGSFLPPGILVSPQQLESQLDHMLAHHSAVDASEIMSAMNDARLPRNSFCVTFDDGFRGQHDIALDILEARGIKGMFFITTCVVEDRILPTVERQRLLQYSNGAYADFYANFVRGVRDIFPSLSEDSYLPTARNIESAIPYYAEYAFYSPMERLYRKVRETMLPNDIFEAVIEDMFGDAFDEEAIIARHFLNWDDVVRMRDRGHSIGGHGHMHLLESNINGEKAAADHRRCLDLLHKKLGAPIETYAYPYGIYAPETINALRTGGVAISFTCRAGRSHESSPLLIDRYDCKAFPFQTNAIPTAQSTAERVIA